MDPVELLFWRLVNDPDQPISLDRAVANCKQWQELPESGRRLYIDYFCLFGHWPQVPGWKLFLELVKIGISKACVESSLSMREIE